jgi:nucleolar protein 58
LLIPSWVYYSRIQHLFFAATDNCIASAINKLPQLSLNLVSDSTTTDLYRSIRNHLPSLIPGLLPDDISMMSLGLSHSLSRHKLKFSTDKVDTMIIQAVSLLDDLDKELNIYAMRVKEWYGWHFPEMARIINDNLAYSRVILNMGMRSNAVRADLAQILPEEIEVAVKSAAEISMGTEITNEDLENIQALAEQVVSFTEYRSQLSSYLSARMMAIAPNLTALVGDLVGARLIAHAGSLMNLAKSPASTIQILGAEKALFRALKTKHDTPKYGLIYHASLIGQATGKNKGKIARMLATKATLGLRVDALADWSAEGEGKGDQVTEEERSALGVENRLKVERRLASLEGRPLRSKGVAIGPNGVSLGPGKWEIKEARKYNPDADGLAGDEPAAAVTEAPKSRKGQPGEVRLIQEVKGELARAGLARSEEEEDNGAESDEEMDEATRPEDLVKGDHEMDEESSPGDESVSKVAPVKIDGKRISSSTKTSDSTIKKSHDDKSEAASTVSDDTADSPQPPTQEETKWESSILGNTKDAKEARKKERHERKLALAEEHAKKMAERNEKVKRRLERRERRQKRAQQLERREEEPYTVQAMQAGLSIARYKRKLERGEIKFNADGKAEAISKKDIKRARKAAEKAERSRNDISGVDEKQQTKKAKSKSSERPEKVSTVTEEQARLGDQKTVDDSSSAPQKKRKRDHQEDVQIADKSEKKKRKKFRA